MDLDEVKERYKLLPGWTRVCLVVFAGLVPAVYIYTEDAEYLEESLESAANEREGARHAFEAARTQKGNIQQLEEKLAATEQQLEVAKEKLPETFLVEDLLQKVAAIGQETATNLDSFGPDGNPKPGTGDYKYMELPHSSEVWGPYNNVASFLDRVAHLDSTVFVKELTLKRRKTASENETPSGAQGTAGSLANLGEDVSHKNALAARKGRVVDATMKLVAFRSMKPGEELLQYDENGNLMEAGNDTFQEEPVQTQEDTEQ